MKPHTIASFSVGLALCLLSACSMLPSDNSQANRSTTASPEAPEDEATPTLPVSDRPDTRVIPISIEGKVIEMELKLFSQEGLPFTTYVPTKDFTSEVSSVQDQQEVQFYFSPRGVKTEKAYLKIILPRQQTSLSDIQDQVLGEQGLLATNGWNLVDRTDIVSYPWAKEKLIYEQGTGSEKLGGAIYIGEHNGRAFYTLTHYPAEYTDGFEPRSTIMLENLQFYE